MPGGVEASRSADDVRTNLSVFSFLKFFSSTFVYMTFFRTSKWISRVNRSSENPFFNLKIVIIKFASLRYIHYGTNQESASKINNSIRPITVAIFPLYNSVGWALTRFYNYILLLRQGHGTIGHLTPS